MEYIGKIRSFPSTFDQQQELQSLEHPVHKTPLLTWTYNAQNIKFI